MSGYLSVKAVALPHLSSLKASPTALYTRIHVTSLHFTSSLHFLSGVPFCTYMHQTPQSLSSSQAREEKYALSASARTGGGRFDEPLFDNDEQRARLTPSPPPPPPAAAASNSPAGKKPARGNTSISPFTTRSKRQNQTSKTATTMKEFMPRTWQATAAAYASVNSAAPPQVVMDPVALLRQCIRYFSTHPETYGTDIQGLLQQEALHVMRLKASELALIHPDPVSYTVSGVADAQASGQTRHSNTKHNTGGGGGAQTFLPPLRERPTAASFGPAFPRQTGRAATDDQTAVSAADQAGTFGYGGISFIEPTPGFLALLEGATTTRDSAATAGLRDSSALQQFQGRAAGSFPAESIGWEGTLTEQDLTAYQGHRGTQPLTGQGEQGPGEANVLEFAGTNADEDEESAAFGQLLSGPSPAGLDRTPGVGSRVSGLIGSVPGYVPTGRTAYGGTTRSAAPIIVDGAGYETSFLRSQLQQLEAAYNARSIRMHEMLEENASLIARLQLAESAAESRLSAYNTLQTQLDMLKRELDGWKDKANDASQQAAAQANKESQQTRKAASTQLSEAKQETAKLAELWRETERAYQESRRALENSEKEANHTHDHLSDAFHYIERLERRVARRNQYIDLCRRRQESMEEKYEKLMWCLRELGTMSGVYSYADARLAGDPLWSLVLFTRLQRHVGDFSPSPQAPVLPPPAVPLLVAPVNTIGFAKSPNGGVLMDDAFDMATVYKMVSDVVTAAEERRGGVRRLRTNLHGSVACRAARVLLPNIIDYLGGADNIPDSSDVNKRKLPLLTLASLALLSTATSADANAAGATEGNATLSLNATVVSSPLTTPGVTASHNFKPDISTTVPNTKQFDQVTLRFLLRQFWKARVTQYMDTMAERRAEALNAMRRQQQAQQARQTSVTTTDNTHRRSTGAKVDTSGFAAVPGDEDGESPTQNTFLSALVCFINRVTTGSAEGHATTTTTTSGAEGQDEDPLVALRIALARNDEEAGLVDSSRVTFATVESARVRYPQFTATSASMADTQHNTTSTGDNASGTPGQNRLMRLRTASNPEVGPKAQELINALYYYALEYKDSDADFRLFYLVSHQLIPEMVGINFYANLQAMERALRGKLADNIQQPESRSTDTQAALAGTATPLDALVQVVRVVDTAPLVGEDVDFELDSDGEGYGSILPGARGDQTSEGLGAVSGRGTADVLHDATSVLLDSHANVNEGSKSRRSVADTRGSSRRASSRASKLSGVAASGRKVDLAATTDDDDRLRHDIRDYLSTLQHRRDDNAFKPLFEEETLTENIYEPQWPPGWEALNERANRALGPHEELLRSFKDSAATGNTRLLNLRQQRDQREAFRLHTSVQLCATRGLLPVADVLDVLHSHGFATYAVTCCGAPRYSLADALFSSGSDRAEDYAEPLDLVGQVPPTEWQLQRLRFALALDQPASLIHVSRLFDLDSRTATPNHFYDEYLSLTLDLVQRQQSLFMDQLLGSCAARHDRYFDEGAEECDGTIPVSFLKSGFTALFRSLGLGKEDANAMVEHLVFYDGLLRLEDEVKLEQFTDAPFMINTTRQDVETRRAAAAFSPASPTTSNNNSNKNSSSPSRAKADTTDGDAWDVHDEMETCSLLHLILALRMTYVVWGVNAQPFAATVSQLLGGIPIDTELETAQEAKRRAAAHSNSTLGAPGAALTYRTGTAASATRRGLWSPAVVQRLADREEAISSFEQSVKVQYVDAAARASCGCQGVRNPLRRTQQRLNAEREKAAQEAQVIAESAAAASAAAEATVADKSGTKRGAAPMKAETSAGGVGKMPQRRSDKADVCDSPTTASAGESPSVAARRGPLPALDRYSVKSSVMPLGLYPDLRRLAASSPQTAEDADVATAQRTSIPAATGKKGKKNNTKKQRTSDTESGATSAKSGEDSQADNLGALNTTALSLARMLGLLNTSNAQLYAHVNEAMSAATLSSAGGAGKKSKAKKKAKTTKASASGLTDALCGLTTTDASEASADLQLQRSESLKGAVERVRVMMSTARASVVGTTSPGAAEGGSPAATHSKTTNSDSVQNRGVKRGARAVAFKEPSEAPKVSEADATVQALRERRVQLNWVPSFGESEPTPSDNATASGAAGGDDAPKQKRVLNVELIQQACAALSL